MKFVKVAIVALIGTSAAIKVRKNDLPHNADYVEKLDSLSRYVNDDDIV